MYSNESTWILFCAGLALKSTMILGIAWLLTLLLRRRSASARHLVWTATSAALLTLPLLSIVLPALPVSVASVPSVVFQTTARSSADVTIPSAQQNTVQTTPPHSRQWLPDWQLSLMLLWALGTVVSLLRTALAYTALWHIRRTSRRVPIDLRNLANTIGLNHDIDVLETGAGTMPMSFGLVHPAISLPADASDWDPQRRNMVLLHELAHVLRNDFASNLVSRAALSLHWWNPLAWFAWRQFLKEQERATDDLVLNTGAPAADYAGHLLEIARTMQTPAMAAAGIGMARRSQLEGRLLAILDSKVNRKTARRASAWVATMAALAIAAPLAMLHAQDSPAQLPSDVDATIRSALAQKNHKMLEDAAKAEESVQKYDIARKLMDTSLQVREEVSGGRSVEYGVGLIKIADLERRRGHIDDAVDFYSRAAAVLGNHPEAAHALIYLGFAALRNKNFAQATDYFEHARVVDPLNSGEASMWLAVTQERQGNLQGADALYRQSLHSASTNTTTLRVYAQFLDRQGRADEAKTIRDQEAVVRKTQSMDRIKASQRPNVYRIGGGVTAPVPLEKPEPQYSEEARLAKLAGTATVYAEIGPDGLAHNVTVVNGLGLGLDEKAIAAISQWKFKPGTKDGQPVTVQAMIEINFRLM